MNDIPFWGWLLIVVVTLVGSVAIGGGLRLLVDRWRERRPRVRNGPPRDPW